MYLSVSKFAYTFQRGIHSGIWAGPKRFNTSPPVMKRTQIRGRCPASSVQSLDLDGRRRDTMMNKLLIRNRAFGI